MIRKILIACTAMLFSVSLSIQAQINYSGNGNSGFGGVLGGGSFDIEDDGTTVTLTFNRGGGNFNDALVIYIDSESGGSPNTSNFTDTGDNLRQAISGFDGTNRSTVNFPTGFEADFAIAANVNSDNFAGLWDVVDSGSHTFVASVNITNDSNTSAASYQMDFDFSEIGISSDVKSFSFVATYLNYTNAFRSDEAVGDGLGSFTQGNNTASFTDARTYYSVNLTSGEGWRMLSTPSSSSTYDDLLGSFWTQGFTNSDNSGAGSSNVQVYNASTPAFESISDQTTTITAGEGFIFYTFSDDDGPLPDEGFPKTMNASGDENSATVSVTTVASEFNLLGNPFAESIDADNLSLGGSDATNDNWNQTVYVYDPNKSGGAGYLNWDTSGGTGDLTDGLISPFQGFFVQSTAGGTSFDFTSGATAASAASFYGKNAEEGPVSLKLEVIEENSELGENFFANFMPNADTGLDGSDALTLTPLTDSFVAFYSILDGVKYDMSSLPLKFDAPIEINLGIDHFVNNQKSGGSYEMNWPEMTNIPDSWNITLIDLVSGDEVDLRSVSSYSFTIEENSKAKIAPVADRLTPVEQMGEVSDARFKLIIKNGVTSSNEAVEQLPGTVTLDQNYPNPFNPSTVIPFSLPQRSEINLSVYTLTGRKVATLVNQVMGAGDHSATFDGSQLSSGIYIYRLETGNVSLTRKLTLIK